MAKSKVIVSSMSGNMNISSPSKDVEIVQQVVPCLACNYPKCDCADYCLKCAAATHPKNIEANK